MINIVVVGAGGFGHECLDVLEAMIAAGSQIQVAGVVDDDPAEDNMRLLSERKVACLGTVDEWLSTAVDQQRYLIGVGDPLMKRHIAEKISRTSAVPFTAIHPSVTIGAGLTISEGAVVCAGVTLSSNVTLGRHVHVNPHATIGHDAILSDWVSVNPAACISGRVRIEEGTLVGAGSVILQNLTVRKGCTIGAGAVVIKDTEPGGVCVGTPARRVR